MKREVMSKVNPVIHLEMGYLDMERMMKLFQTVSGWTTRAIGPDTGHYGTAHTTKTDEIA